MKFNITYTENTRYNAMTRTTFVEALNEQSAVRIFMGVTRFNKDGKHENAKYIVDKIEEVKEELLPEEIEVEKDGIWQINNMYYFDMK